MRPSILDFRPVVFLTRVTASSRQNFGRVGDWPIAASAAQALRYLAQETQQAKLQVLRPDQ